MITGQELNKGLLPLKIIWFAMLMSLVIYLFVGLYAGTHFSPLMKEDALGILRTLLYVVSLITLIATRYIRKLFLLEKGQYQQASQSLQHFALERYKIATIVALALSESIGIYGLVLFFLGKNHMDLYLLIAMSAVAMFLYRPKRDELFYLTQEG